MKVVCDIETERLFNPQHIWCIVCKDVDTGEVFTFEPYKDPLPFQEFSKRVTTYIGHNFLLFDRPVLNRLLAVEIDPSNVIDTLVLSRLLNYKQPGGHSLENWGSLLIFPKIHLDVSFEHPSRDLMERCVNDVHLGEKVYKQFLPFLENPLWEPSIRLEHESAALCQQLHDNGFYFNHDGAKALYQEILTKLEELDKELISSFPPRAKLLKEITPKPTKFGTIHKQDFRWVTDGDLSPFSVGWPFSRIEWVTFNPGSSKQRIEVLNEAGWKPFEKTKGHKEAEKELRFCRDPKRREELKAKLDHYQVYGWTTSEDNLATLPETAPEPARRLVERLILANRKSTMDQWFSAYREETGRVHGSFNHIGSWTHRKSHDNPNMANIPAIRVNEKKEKLYGLEGGYGIEMRSLWTVPPKRCLVGTDADGIQLRILAHYMNDPAFTEALVNGDSKLGTDAHTLNQKALNQEEFICKTRDNSKTFIYAWLLGAGTGMVSHILECSLEQARRADTNFVDYYPGLKYLKGVEIPQVAEQGWFRGFDGRIVFIPDPRKVLAGYLQNGETVIMKRACRHWTRQLTEEGIWFMLVNDVHDEWQTEIEDDPDLAQYVGKIQAESIRIVAEELQLRCPFKGNFKIGHNWFETH
jgi:DNA polymerase-1